MAEQMMQHKADELAAKQTIPAGYKQTEVGVIPEDWSTELLGYLAEKVMVGIASAATHAYCRVGIPLIRNQNIKPNKLDADDLLFINETYESSFKGKRLRAGDLLTARTGYPGTTCIVPPEFENAQSFTTLITRPTNKINSLFLSIFMNSDVGTDFFDANQIGGGQKNINAATLKNFIVAFPDSKEQTAIANVLSDSDGLIDALEQLIAKKQAIKSATMQQLLTGRTRLPAFALRPDGTPKGYKPSELGHIPEDWHEVSLSSVTKNIDAGVSVNSIDQLDAYGHGKHVLKTSCVNGGVFNCLEAKSIIPSDTGRAKCFPCEGNIIVSRMNTPALVGEIGYIEKSLPGYFLPDRLWQVSFREDAELNTKWLMYVLAHPINSKKIKESATGTSNSMKNISKNAFLALNFYKPNIEEQTAIATILSDMDSELTALEQKLAKARDVKQGMMQQLLTGRIRLPVEQVE